MIGWPGMIKQTPGNSHETVLPDFGEGQVEKKWKWYWLKFSGHGSCFILEF
jgi:hypothetical protein